MIPFHSRFQDLAARETRCVHVLTPGGHLPLGEYGFVEWYCEDPDCDCRRVLLQVINPTAANTILATINYGWESAEFYARRLHGDSQAAREIVEASLDPLNPQSQYADSFLDVFRTQLMTDPDYMARLARHYAMFKADLKQPETSTPSPSSETPPSAPMSVPDILKQLQHLPNGKGIDFAPYERALRAAGAQREAITPELIAALERVASDAARYLRDTDNCVHLFAVYLLAEFRETRALGTFVRLFSLPGETALDLTGDLVTEKGAAFLASVCGGQPGPLLQLVYDETVNEFVRGQALQALMVQVLWGERPREAAVEDLRSVFTLLPKPGDGYVWAELVSLVCDFSIHELAPQARQAFADGLVDDTVLDLDFFEKELRHAGAARIEEFRARNAPIDAANECSAWICFRNEDDYRDLGEDDEEVFEVTDAPADAVGLPEGQPPVSLKKPTPYVAPPKVGRNDPCPCGSGKKYKKCCGR